MKYVADHSWKKDPIIAKERNSLAQMYRNLRCGHPDMARLLYVRHRAALNMLKKSFYKNIFGLDYE